VRGLYHQVSQFEMTNDDLGQSTLAKRNTAPFRYVHDDTPRTDVIEFTNPVLSNSSHDRLVTHPHNWTQVLPSPLSVKVRTEFDSWISAPMVVSVMDRLMVRTMEIDNILKKDLGSVMTTGRTILHHFNDFYRLIVVVETKTIPLSFSVVCENRRYNPAPCNFGFHRYMAERGMLSQMFYSVLCKMYSPPAESYQS
jgi:hypothetical protein